MCSVESFSRLPDLKLSLAVIANATVCELSKNHKRIFLEGRTCSKAIQKRQTN